MPPKKKPVKRKPASKKAAKKPAKRKPISKKKAADNKVKKEIRQINDDAKKHQASHEASMANLSSIHDRLRGVNDRLAASSAGRAVEMGDLHRRVNAANELKRHQQNKPLPPLPMVMGL